MKECKKCKGVFPVDDFYVKDGKNCRQTMCKKCFSKYCTERWRKIKEDAISYKGGKCEKCGYDRCIDAFDLHHIDPCEKELDWRQMRRKSATTRKRELDKCQLLCANCHRELHFDMKGS